MPMRVRAHTPGASPASWRGACLVALLLVQGPVQAAWFGKLFAGDKPANVGTGTLAPCPPTPNCVSSLATDPQQRVVPFSVTGRPEVALQLMVEAIGELPNVRVATFRADYAHLEFTSSIMGFVDDVELKPDASGVIHVRSASRLGRSDFGVNRKRVEELRVVTAMKRGAPR